MTVVFTLTHQAEWFPVTLTKTVTKGQNVNIMVALWKLKVAITKVTKICGQTKTSICLTWLLWKLLLDRLLWTVSGCTWVHLVSASSVVMAPQNIFPRQREVSMMCFSCAAVSLSSPASMLCCPFLVLLQKSLISTCWNPSLLGNLCLGQTLLMQCNYLGFCCCAQSCHGVWHVTWNFTLAADFSCSSPIFKPPTQLFLFQLMTVFQPTYGIDGH